MSLISFFLPLLVICLLKTWNVSGSSERFLLYSKSSTFPWDKSKIFKLPINSNGLSSSQQALVKSISYTFQAISYDPTTKRMYWADDTYFDSEIRSVSLDGSDEKIVVTELGTVVALAVDLAGRNLYWADCSRNRIEVARLDGSFRKKLFDVTAPTSMVLDLETREIYWSSYVPWQVKIEKASMDGSDRSVILSSSSRKKPTGLSIDSKNQILYWAERRKQEIYYIKLTAPNTVRIILTTSYKPFRIANIGQRIYWTERGNYWSANGEIGSLNTTSESDIKILVNNINFIGQIYAYDPDQPYYGNTKCGANKGGCEHLCLQSPQNDKCVCTDGMILNDDGKSCHFREFVLAVDHIRKKIFRKSLDDLSRPRTTLSLGRVGYINTVDYDPVDERVYWTDGNARISRAFLNGSSIEKVIDSFNLHPKGHAIDVMGRNIYWYDEMSLAIGVSKLDGLYHKTLVKLTNIPMAISLCSKQGYVYWAHSLRRKITIKRSQMNGTNEENVVSEWKSNYRVHSVWLAFDSETKRLYFHSDHDIWYTDTKLLNGAVHTLNLAASWVLLTSGLAVKESYLYWGNLHDAKVYRVNKTSLKSVKTVMREIKAINLHVYHNYTDTPDFFHPCAQNNGWCTHLCLINPIGYSCICPTYSGTRKCHTTPVVPSISRSRPHPPSTSSRVVLVSSSLSSPVGSSLRVDVVATSLYLSVSLSRHEISSAYRSSSSRHVSSSDRRISTIQLHPSSYSVSSSNLHLLSTSFQVVMPYFSYLFSQPHTMSSSKLLPTLPPLLFSIKRSLSFKSSNTSAMFLSTVPKVSSTNSRFSSPSNGIASIGHFSSTSLISSPIYKVSSIPNILSSYFIFSSQPLHSSVKAITKSSLHPVLSLYCQTVSQGSPKLFPNPTSYMFFSQDSSNMPLASSSTVVLLASSPVLPTTTQLSRAHTKSSPVVSSTSSLVLTSKFLLPSISLSSLTSLLYKTTTRTSSLRPITSHLPSFARISKTSTIVLKVSSTTTTTPPLSTIKKSFSKTLVPKTRTSRALLWPSTTASEATTASSAKKKATSSSLSKISSTTTKIRISTTTATTKWSSAATKASPSPLLKISSKTTKIRTSSSTPTNKSSSTVTKALSFSLLKTSSTTVAKLSPASTQRLNVTSTTSVPLSSRPPPTLLTTETTSSFPTLKPKCPPQYYGYSCSLFIGEDKMSVTIKKDSEKLSKKTFKRSVSKGVTEYCLKDSCRGLLRSFKKSRRDTKTTTKFSPSDVIVLSDPTIFSIEDEVITIQFALTNPFAQDSSVITRSVLCKLVSNAKEIIQGLLQGPKISKIDPECDAFSVNPGAGQQKGGDGTPTSVTISLSVLFVILFILVVLYFVIRYIRKKASSKRKSKENRKEFSFQNIGYLQDESAMDPPQPTFTTPNYNNNQNFNDKTIRKSTSGRQTAWNDIPNGLPTSSSPHLINDLEIDNYDQIQVTTPFPPLQDRPFRYARLNPKTTLNHDYQALSLSGGMGSTRENEYAEVNMSFVGNPLYESVVSRTQGTISTDNPLYHTSAAGCRPRNIRDNDEMTTGNSPRHVYKTPQRSNFFENSKITFVDNPRKVNGTPNRWKNSYENAEIVKIEDVQVNGMPKSSRNACENDEVVRIGDVHYGAIPSSSSNAIYESDKSKTPSSPTDEHVYDRLKRFHSLTNNDRDGTNYDHLRRYRPVRVREGQGESQSSNEEPVLQIDGPDDREETII